MRCGTANGERGAGGKLKRATSQIPERHAPAAKTSPPKRPVQTPNVCLVSPVSLFAQKIGLYLSGPFLLFTSQACPLTIPSPLVGWLRSFTGQWTGEGFWSNLGQYQHKMKQITKYWAKTNQLAFVRVRMLKTFLPFFGTINGNVIPT